MALVRFLLISRKGWGTSGIGCLDDSVEVEHDGVARLITEIQEVESDASRLPLNAGDEFADLYIVLDGVDMDDIVGTGVAGTKTGVEFQFYVETIGCHFPLLPSVAWQKLHPTDKTGGEEQTRIVDIHQAIIIDKVLFVEIGELVVLDVTVAVGFLGKPALDGGAKDRGGVLHGFEEGALSQLCFRLLVIDLRRTATTEGFSKASVKDTVAYSTRLFDDGWFDFGHCFYCLVPLI